MALNVSFLPFHPGDSVSMQSDIVGSSLEERKSIPGSGVSLKTFSMLTRLVDLFPLADLGQGQFMGY